MSRKVQKTHIKNDSAKRDNTIKKRCAPNVGNRFGKRKSDIHNSSEQNKQAIERRLKNEEEGTGRQQTYTSDASKDSLKTNEPQIERCESCERRNNADRRKNHDPEITKKALAASEEVVDRRIGFDRRRGPGRRRSDDRKSAEEGNMSDEQFEFLMAIDNYKKQNSRPFPTWTEVLEVIKALGYRKVAEPQSLAQFKKAD